MAISNLKSSGLVIAFAWVTHVLSWFLPVVTLGGAHGEFFETVRGWVAFRVALSPILPYQDFHHDAWYYSVLSVASAVTTFVFIAGSPLAVWRGSCLVRRACAWVAITAFIVNSHWYVLFGSDRKDLRIGYFLWWLSFGLLAIGLFRLPDNSKVSQNTQVTQTEGS